MSAVTANVHSKVDHSCNWKCCFGNNEIADPPTPAVTPEPLPTIVETDEKSTSVFKEAQRHLSAINTKDGMVDVEFDAVHIRVKKTPTTTPEASISE